jgi:hypothetical protein
VGHAVRVPREPYAAKPGAMQGDRRTGPTGLDPFEMATRSADAAKSARDGM